MNKHLEEQLEAWGHEKEAVPEFFSKGIDNVLANLPDQQHQLVRSKPKTNRKLAKILVSSAAVLSFGVIGSGFVSPTMANVLKEVPLIGSIFEASSDRSLQIIEEKGLATKLNETITDNGVSLTITEAFFGGGRLAVGYTIETDKVPLQSYEKGQGSSLNFDALLDGKRFNYIGDTEQIVKNGIASGILDMAVGLESELSDSPTLQLTVNEVSSVKGSWKFTIPVSNNETLAATAAFNPMVSTKWDDATFVVEKSEFTPTRSQIIIDRTMPRENIEHYSFAAYDENGTWLGFEGGSGSSIIDVGNGYVNFKDTLLLKGRDTAPKGLIIEVFNNHGELFDPSNVEEVKISLTDAKFPYTIHYPDNSELIITNFEQLEDQSVLYYDIKGALGLQNAFVMLEDGNGERFSSEKNAERTSLDQLSFIREFPKTAGPISLITEVEKMVKRDKKIIEIDLAKKH